MFVLLAPLIWTSVNPTMPAEQSQVVEVIVNPSSRPKVELSEGRYVIHPPEDKGLLMTVLEHKPAPSVRGPASAFETKPVRTIEVIVSAP